MSTHTTDGGALDALDPPGTEVAEYVPWLDHGTLIRCWRLSGTSKYVSVKRFSGDGGSYLVEGWAPDVQRGVPDRRYATVVAPEQTAVAAVRRYVDQLQE